MLSKLFIQNIALIDRLDMSVSAGFNVLTGETGAGKSIIIDSVNLLLGERADRELIQSGQERALAEGVFDIPEGPLLSQLQDLGVEPEEGQIILSRELSSGGKNLCRINGRLASLSLLKSVSDLLVDIHGQHEHQTLLSPDRHLPYLDAFAAGKLQSLKAKVAQEYGEYRALCSQIKQGFGTAEERERRIDMLTYQIGEIEAAALVAGEEEALKAERSRMQNAEHIQTALSGAYTALQGEEESAGALSLLNSGALLLGEISSYDEQYAALSAKMKDIYYSLEDISFELRNLRESSAFDPFRQEQVEERLDLIHRLCKKYGSTTQDVLNYLQRAREELDGMEQSRILAQQSEQLKAAKRAGLYQLCIELSEARQEAAKELEERILEQLKQLGMDKARFSMQFSPLPRLEEAQFTKNGLDHAQMLLTTNPGEPLKPLHKVASGGELSRIMLALKSIQANVDSKPCLIFDEIDTGISGRIADVVGEKMRALSRTHQVICVTHSPQIAAKADAHYLIKKSEKGGRAITSVSKLDEENHILEIARIASGARPSQAAIAHARELVRLSR